MMKEGSLVRTTSSPFSAPMMSEMISAIRIASHMFMPYWTESMAMIIPEEPIREPTERSNSPPIISRATATDRMPSSAAISR